jgi:hypothetical protein
LAAELSDISVSEVGFWDWYVEAEDVVASGLVERNARAAWGHEDDLEGVKVYAGAFQVECADQVVLDAGEEVSSEV